MTIEALDYFYQLAKLLQPVGLLTETDVHALTMHAETLALRDEVRVELDDGPLVTPGAKGQKISNPALTLFLQLQQRVEEQRRGFGMDPVSRNLLGRTAPQISEAEDQWARLVEPHSSI